MSTPKHKLFPDLATVREPKQIEELDKLIAQKQYKDHVLCPVHGSIENCPDKGGCDTNTEAERVEAFLDDVMQLNYNALLTGHFKELVRELLKKHNLIF